MRSTQNVMKATVLKVVIDYLLRSQVDSVWNAECFNANHVYQLILKGSTDDQLKCAVKLC